MEGGALARLGRGDRVASAPGFGQGVVIEQQRRPRFDRPLLDEREVRVVDCRGVPGHARDLDGPCRRAEAAAKILDTGQDE